jgi:hypothetical protein
MFKIGFCREMSAPLSGHFQTRTAGAEVGYAPTPYGIFNFWSEIARPEFATFSDAGRATMASEYVFACIDGDAVFELDHLSAILTPQLTGTESNPLLTPRSFPRQIGEDRDRLGADLGRDPQLAVRFSGVAQRVG